MTSVKMRENPLFMRNGFETVGKWNIPLIRKQKFDLKEIRLISCSNTKANDSEINKKCGVHFFAEFERRA